MTEKEEMIERLNETIRVCNFFLDSYGVDTPEMYFHYYTRRQKARKRLEKLMNS